MNIRPFLFVIIAVSALLISSCNVASYIDKRAERQYQRLGGTPQQVELKEATISYRMVGDEGSHLLLLHGFGPNPKTQWIKQIKPLAKKHRLIVPELLYFGDSRPASSRRVYSLEHQAKLMKSLLDSLAIEQTNILAVSYGGLVASFFYVKYPDLVDKIIISGAPIQAYSMDFADSLAKAHGRPGMKDLLLPSNGEELNALLQIASYKPPRLGKKALNKIALQYYFNQRFEKGALLDYLYRSESFLKQLSFRTDKEVLLIWGAEDQLVPPAIGRHLKDYYGENAQMMTISKAGHSVNAKKAKAFNKAVLKFLEEDNPAADGKDK